MGKLDNEVAIVTGASRGIGKVIAKLLAAEGAKVVCAARTMHEGDHVLEGSLSTTVSEIQGAGGQALAVQTDVSKEESCTQLVETTKQQFGPVDVLVNNAGLNYFSLIKDMPIKRWTLGFAVNMHGPFMLSQKVLPDMIERRRGAIINVSSPGAIRSYGLGDVMYGATKAALNRFTQGLAEEVYQYGISVSAVSPVKAVITPGIAYHKFANGLDEREVEPPEMTAQSVLLLATEPLEKVSGRVFYTLEILKEYGLIKP